MSKTVGESQYGFKDRAKAEETITLLLDHDLAYRKLTVRGLLGRAKRVLTMTKAEEKVKNITEAISVFEEWLEQNGGGSSNKNTKPNSSDDKVETVAGLGFKDKEAAVRTLQILEGRDPDYQKLAVKGLIGSSKRVLGITKNEDKLKQIKEGVAVLDEFLEQFDKENRSKYTYAYLDIKICSSFPQTDDQLSSEFLTVYRGPAKGNYKHLRTLFPKDDDSKSWDIVRNREIKTIKATIDANDLKLFGDDGAPTAVHLSLIQWAYSPNVDKVKTHIQKSGQGTKRKSAAISESSSDNDDSNEGKSSNKRSKAQ